VDVETRIWQSFEEAQDSVRPFLAGQHANPFLRYDWLRLYHAAFPERGRPWLVGVFRQGRLATFAPLAVRWWAGIPVISFLAAGRSDINGFAGEVTAETVDAVANATLGRLGSAVFVLADVRADDPLASLLGARFPSLMSLRPYPNPLRDLSSAAPADSKSNRKFQSRIPPYARRLEAFGEVRQEVFDFDACRDRALALLPQLWALHDLRHATRRNAWKEPANRGFLEEFIHTSGDSGLLAFVLFLDGLPVAFDLGFRAGTRYHLYIPAFHPAFERFRLGHVNRWLSFEKCRQMGLEIYDFSRGDSFAKRVWANSSVDSLHCIAAAGSWPAHLLARVRALAGALKIRGRESGFNRVAGNWLSRLSAKAKEAKKPGAPASSASPSLSGPVRFRDIAPLPLPALTEVVERVFEATGRG
jgi:CelD/BcsL family acetyltransferase involved in cellulose biosynthesis